MLFPVHIHERNISVFFDSMLIESINFSKTLGCSSLHRCGQYEQVQRFDSTRWSFESKFLVECVFAIIDPVVLRSVAWQ